MRYSQAEGDFMNIERLDESSARFRGVDFDARLTLIDSA